MTVGTRLRPLAAGLLARRGGWPWPAAAPAPGWPTAVWVIAGPQRPRTRLTGRSLPSVIAAVTGTWERSGPGGPAALVQAKPDAVRESFTMSIMTSSGSETEANWRTAS